MGFLSFSNTNMVNYFEGINQNRMNGKNGKNNFYRSRHCGLDLQPEQ